MQQTAKYKLNLIEPSDPFLPEALNQNTQKVEDVLIGKMEGPVAELDQRVTALEAHKFTCGYYLGTGSEVELLIGVGFKPKGAIVRMVNSQTRFFIEGAGRNDDGLSAAGNSLCVTGPANTGGHWYHYFVFG